MPEFNTDIQTADGAMDCFVAIPDTEPNSGRAFTPIILYMDVPGIREELRDMARRFATDGFVCVLPDLYYRAGKVRFDLTKGQEELKKMFAIGSTLSNAMVLSDTRGILDWLAARDDCNELVGTVGHCMSGQFVFSIAGTYPERVRASAALYGTRMVTDQDDSPHLLAAHCRGEMYLGFAEHDPYVEDTVAPTLRAALDANPDLHYELEHFAGTDHGFCFPQRPAFDEHAAEAVWTKLVAMYRRALSG